MLAKLKLAWDEEKLTELRQEARWLVEREAAEEAARVRRPAGVKWWERPTG